MKAHLRIVDENETGPATATGSLEDAFRRFGPYVARVAYRLLGRYEEVEDVVQDVFIDAGKSLHQLERADRLRGWLRAITVRKCIRRLRMHRLKRLVALDDAPDYDGLVTSGASAEQRILLGQVYRALDEVPAASRVAWSLRYLDDEPLDTIAQACGCSLATVKRRIAEAQARIDRVVSK